MNSGRTQLQMVIEFLHAHQGWWCATCIERSMGVGSPERVIVLLRYLGQAVTVYSRANYTECEGCAKTRKCIRLLQGVTHVAA